jgi:two-component system chemotaxis sensor kinase CheA
MTAVPAALLDVFRAEANERIGEISDCLLAIEAGNPPAGGIDMLFRHAHSLKGGASMVGFTEAGAIAHSIEDVLEPARAQGSLAPELVDSLLRATDDLRQAVSEGPDASPENGSASTPPDGGTSVPPSRARKLEPERSAPPASPASSPGSSVRLATEKVDRMLDTVGEAVVQQRRLEHLIGRQTIESSERLKEEIDREERLLGELQDAALEMRMLPLSAITGRFPRAVRDLALAEGKEVELEISGVETQLDRVLLDGLADAITHLLRNAIAHGVEEPEARERAGKPRAGRITLHAESRGELVAIQVADDGRGVSTELREEVARRGSLVDVLAEAGFSTAEQVSTLAGRGVGLDAVKRQSESLGGRLEMESPLGQGMRATLLLPVTLARFDALIVERGEQRFGIPIASVVEVVALGGIATLEGKPYIEVRGESLRLSDFARAIGARASDLAPAAQALVMGDAAARVAVACDRVLGEEEVVVKSLGTMMTAVPGYLGAAILGDGGIMLIVDPAYLVRNAARASTGVQGSGTVPAQPAPPPAAAPHVLVVDDQFIVRELERSILDAAGYRVRTACHGREALEAIANDPGFDLVVTDLQMPELDGLGLLAAIRADPDHAMLPVVIVTSQSSDEDRRRGAEAGADAYIVKDEFDQQALLETVNRLIGR